MTRGHAESAIKATNGQVLCCCLISAGISAKLLLSFQHCSVHPALLAFGILCAKLSSSCYRACCHIVCLVLLQVVAGRQVVVDWAMAKARFTDAAAQISG